MAEEITCFLPDGDYLSMSDPSPDLRAGANFFNCSRLSPRSKKACSPLRTRSLPLDTSPLSAPQQILNEARKKISFALPRCHEFQGRFCPFSGALRSLQPNGRLRPLPPANTDKPKKRKSKKDMSDPEYALERKRLLNMWNEDWSKEEDVKAWNECEPKMEKLKRKFRLIEAADQSGRAECTRSIKKRKEDRAESTTPAWPDAARKLRKDAVRAESDSRLKSKQASALKAGLNQISKKTFDNLYAEQAMSDWINMIDTVQLPQQMPRPDVEMAEEECSKERAGWGNVIDPRLLTSFVA